MSAYSDAVLADSPIAYWRLNTGSGTETDLGSGGHTLTYNGAVSRLVGGLISDRDSAAYFSTTSTYCNTPNVADLRFTTGPWAVEAWVRPATVTGAHVVIDDCSSGGGFGYRLGIADGKMRWTIPSINDIDSVTTTITAGTNQHLVWHFAADKSITYYKNGVGETIANPDVATASTSADLVISMNNAATENFVGTIDEVALYSGGLSAARVLAHYTAGTLTSTANEAWMGA